MNNNKLDLTELLDYIDPADLDYTEWLNVGMALKEEGYTCDVWDEWSRKDPERYEEGGCYGKWLSFQDSGITGATITQMAKENGWEGKRHKVLSGSAVRSDGLLEIGGTLEWIEDTRIIEDTGWLETEEFQEPSDEKWNPVNDLRLFLTTLFDENDIVGYVMQSRKLDGKEKYTPKNAGTFHRRLKDILDELDSTQDIKKSLGTYDEKAGAWIRINNLNGHGVKNQDVVGFRYALVECDNMDIPKQIAMIKELQLPVATMTYSGNKSVHCLVRVDAKNYSEYKQRVNELYKVCEDNGLTLDKQNKNPSRLSRIAGVKRGSHKQFLIATNIGQANYEDWQKYIEEMTDNLPDPESLADVWDDLPEPQPELIEGILRQGHKMLISGPSKAGKSFWLQELAVDIAEGFNWCGRRCTQGKVLYVNLEIDRASCLQRFKAIYDALGMNHAPNRQNIVVWSLRGCAVPLNVLAPKLIRRAKEQNFLAVIIDPIYKVITGDENNASDMAMFCNQFDKIANELECSVIYCHHHSKGGQGQKQAQDRMSGSGVFARDPDAVLDMVQLDLSERLNEEHTGWRVEGVLREFPSPKPIDMWFKYPLHTVDYEGVLADESPITNETLQNKIRAEQNEKRKQEKAVEEQMKQQQLIDGYQRIAPEGEKVTALQLADAVGVSKKTVERWIEKDTNFNVFDPEYVGGAKTYTLKN